MMEVAKRRRVYRGSKSSLKRKLFLKMLTVVALEHILYNLEQILMIINSPSKQDKQINGKKRKCNSGRDFWFCQKVPNSELTKYKAYL